MVLAGFPTGVDPNLAPLQDRHEKAITRMHSGDGPHKPPAHQRIWFPDQFAFSLQSFQLRPAIEHAEWRFPRERFLDDLLIFFRLQRASGVHQSSSNRDLLHRRQQNRQLPPVQVGQILGVSIAI